MNDKRHILVRMFWLFFAVIGTPIFSIWSAIDESKGYAKLAWRDFKTGFFDWFEFLKKTISDVNRDL